VTRPARATDRYDDVPLSALLQAARRTYTHAVDVALSQAGCDDLPATGAHLISAMHWSGASLEAVIQWMGATKQAVGQAVDTLADRGYLERTHDPSDRRKVHLILSERGREAGRAARSAVERVDRELLARVGVRKVSVARTTLITLLEMGSRARGPRGSHGPGA